MDTRNPKQKGPTADLIEDRSTVGPKYEGDCRPAQPALADRMKKPTAKSMPIALQLILTTAGEKLKERDTFYAGAGMLNDDSTEKKGSLISSILTTFRHGSDTEKALCRRAIRGMCAKLDATTDFAPANRTDGRAWADEAEYIISCLDGNDLQGQIADGPDALAGLADVAERYVTVQIIGGLINFDGKN